LLPVATSWQRRQGGEVGRRVGGRRGVATLLKSRDHLVGGQMGKNVRT